MNRKYDKEFKLNAIKLYRKGYKGQQQLAQELGIPESTFGGWIRSFQENGENSFPGSGNLYQ